MLSRKCLEELLPQLPGQTIDPAGTAPCDVSFSKRVEL